LEFINMSSIQEQRNYNLTDAELCMAVSNLCNTLTRDISDLEPFGISEAKITSFKALGDAFELFPSDDVLTAYVTGAVEAKNQKAEEVRETIRNMVVRCETKWGNSSWQENSLGASGMNQMIDDVLLVLSRRVQFQMNEFLPELADTGLTEQMLDDFRDLNEEFELALNDVKNKIGERDMKTRERILKGNELYKLFATYSDIGKRVFAKSDSARYNDYIIYQKEAGGLSVPQNFIFDFIGKTFWWDLVSHATSYQLERKEGEDYVEIYSGSDTSFTYTPPDGQGFYRVRARNMNGFGPATEDLEQWYYAVLPPASGLTLTEDVLNPGQYELSWTPVPTATEYSIYRSVVNTGQPAGDYSLQGKTAEANFIVSVESGKRNYFRVNTKNLSQYAVPSEPVWLEV